MAKEFRAWNKDGTTFGMDVDSTKATKALKKAYYKTRTIRIGEVDFNQKYLCIDSRWVASMMGDAAWLVTEHQDFTHIQIDDGPRYKVIYPEKNNVEM